MTLCKRGLHELTPENILPGTMTGCRECKRERERERWRQDRPARAFRKRVRKRVEAENPYRADYEYGLAIAQKRRHERQKLIRQHMQARQEWFDSLPEKTRRQWVFMDSFARN